MSSPRTARRTTAPRPVKQPAKPVRQPAKPVRPAIKPVRQDVRERILQEATRQFAARGFEGTSLADIAAGVGLRKPSLLYHYSSKDELRRAVLEQLLEHWNDVLPRLLLAATSGEGRFDAVLHEMIGFFSADPDRARILVREALDRPVEMGELVAMHTPPWVEMVSGYIRRGQAEGLIHADVDPEAYVIQVVNLVIAGIATWDCIGAISGSVARPSSSARKSREGATSRLPARHVAEMLRMAKAALFSSVPAPMAARAKPVVSKSKSAPGNAISTSIPDGKKTKSKTRNRSQR